MKSAGKPGNRSPKPDGSRLQAVYEPRNLAHCGHWIAFGRPEVKADVVVMTEGSSSDCDMASDRNTTGVQDQGMQSWG